MKPPKRYTFLVDEDLGRTYAEALAEDGRFDVEQVTELYGSGAKDYEWIPELQNTGMIAITHDGSIRNDHESVVLDNNARIIVSVGKNRTTSEQAENFCNTWASIERYLKKTKPPCMARLTMPTPQDIAKKSRHPNAKQRAIPGKINPYLPRKPKK